MTPLVSALGPHEIENTKRRLFSICDSFIAVEEMPDQSLMSSMNALKQINTG